MKREKIFYLIFLLLALFSVVSVALICFFLFSKAVITIKEIGFINFIFKSVWKPTSGLYGIFSMIVASLCVTLLSVIIALPLGGLCSIYLAFFAPKKIEKVILVLVELLSGLPSIIFGFFALTVIVPMMQNAFGGSGKGLLTSSILLSFMIIPTIITIFYSSFKSSDSSLLLGSLALGESKEKTMFRLIIPSCKKALLSGLVMAMGRSIGETMAVIMVAGNQALIPTSILSGVRTMTANIVLEMGYATGLHRDALITTGAVLFLFTLLINFTFSLLRGDKNK